MNKTKGYWLGEYRRARVNGQEYPVLFREYNGVAYVDGKGSYRESGDAGDEEWYADFASALRLYHQAIILNHTDKPSRQSASIYEIADVIQHGYHIELQIGSEIMPVIISERPPAVVPPQPKR